VYETRPCTRVSTVVGRQRSLSDVSKGIKQALADDGDRIVVCDIRGMTAPVAAVANMFAPLSDYLDCWPGAGVVVWSEDGAVLTSLADRAPERLVARADGDAGVVEVERMLPPVQQARVRLPADPSAARLGRTFATRALEDWQMPDSVGTTALVVSELVTNSIRHAQTINELTLSLAQDRLRVAVHDLAPGSPVPSPHLDADAVDGRGLFLVGAMSRTWGVFPSTLSGKTVWAILDTVQQEQTLS
jgi:serine/threonine-protein kinase RsbW